MSLLALAVLGRGAVDPTEPVVLANDEAVLRGRAAFETMRVYGGRPFKLGAHLDRLESSAGRIGLPHIARAELEALTHEALGASDAPEATLRLIWTPGAEAGPPAALALVSSLPPELEELRARGLRAITLLGVRARAPWLLGGVKSTSYAVNMAADAEAKRRGADDAIFVDEGGLVLEGPVTNIWWRVGEKLFTPGLDLGILAGVTRATILELTAINGYEVREGTFAVDELAAAEEAFTSSSVREVMPVVELDGAPVGTGAPGPAARRLQAELRRVAAGV